jgi:biofilm protein TabA
MIIDSVKNAAKYYSVHPLFAKAFEYINSTDLASTEDGKYDTNKKGVTAEASVAKFECHDKHIDIQLCISGNEQIGWKPREKCTTPNGAYNPDKDVQLYNDQPDTFFSLTDGQFAIFFPEDVHAPMIGDAEIKKLVVKVKI